ncbi:hypothetical protein L1987_70371 [Smallanthus sonchifolius]|uniref:Uncharacterized protein n=1 Tax=Smallanthus sonchifolius TaxID=185202 RepID=A0ACB9APQ7_9ASTR|nr:hypothetical protein L1987_70371 [Smallanthus sonchifolius]
MAEQRWRLVLTASPRQGHMTPMLHLATFLHSKGFSITIRPDPSNHPHFTFLSLPYNLSAIGDFATAVQFLQTLNDNCSPHFREHLIQMMMMKKDKESIVIVYDNLMFFAGSVAGDLGLPSIILRTSSASFFPAIKIVPQLHQQGRFPVQGSVRGFEWIEFLPEGLVSEMKVKGLVVKWAPQKEVLAHSAVGGFWNQKVNSTYLSYVWKMGVEVVVERGEIEGVIRIVLVGKEGEEMKQRAMEMQEKVKVAVRHGGSSHNL